MVEARRGRPPGELAKFRCHSCGGFELATGGTSKFICHSCKPAGHFTNSLQYKAHQAVAKAKRTGELRPACEFDCVDCGKPAVEYDHRDYSKPLEVSPVCRRCNLLRGPALNHVLDGAAA